ncbi:Alpha-amylase [Pseudoalteromonas holothuriae]|uniref:Alpha-amylase n=1 Tax=Pseudoalteromonas holothuriae TaxID=2963714 RepID=A0A9W4QUC0_9GAMM|nr:MULTISPECIES: alpha-amylase family protein [unclassified Pseudoalteromonas]CAH9053467.1 Alpha-amylase [Pseudoalteromonas sp. CIP111854]CAH9061328.1 Alpha-amylase [Pseudoalteromonas sp. CIP111951]
MTTLNKISKFSAASGAALLCFAHSAQAQPTTFVHLFEWSWPDVAQECETFLGPKGYAAVQVSPPNEHITGAPWWTRYQPVSYQLQSRGGTQAQFKEMVTRCKQAGVDIYVDAVINHMAAGSGQGIAGTSYGIKQFPMYSPQDFHPSCAINNADYGNNAWRVQNCELVGLADLDTDTTYVQSQLSGFLNTLVSAGVAGFRLDASKHMPASDIATILSQVNGTPLIFQEVIDQGGEAVSANEYFGNGLVTEFKYTTKLGETFKNGKLAWLSNFGEAWGMMPSYKAVVFVDNHDNQRGHGGAGNVVTFADGKLYDLANVFMLAYPYGYPKVMSSFEFNHDSDAGPPSVTVHDNGQLNCFADQWQCEHRHMMISGAVDFRNNTTSHWQVNNWWDNGNNQIAFSRGNEGFVAINRDSEALTRTLQTGLAQGAYCDVLTGSLNANKSSCSGRTVTVNTQGYADVTLTQMDALAIHHKAKIVDDVIEPMQRTVIFIKAETQAGQDMFVRGGIDHNYAQSIGRNCTQDASQCALKITHNNLKNSTTNDWKVGDHYLDWSANEATQNAGAQGSPLDWTTNIWPDAWGVKRVVSQDGYGETPLNLYGDHYWMLDVQMDCSNSIDGWFELKAYVKNGQGWEGDIAQIGTPYTTNNHFAQCGKINVFEFAKNSARYADF